MIYKQKIIEGHLSQFIKSIWLVDSETSKEIIKQKIIPDGYPEMIFHYKDPYKINIFGKWEEQEKQLLAGQISKFFYLKNSGYSGIIGIKFQPWAISSLFKIEMHYLTDKIIKIPNDTLLDINEINNLAETEMDCDDKLVAIEALLNDYLTNKKTGNIKGQNAIKAIINKNGIISSEELETISGMNERALQRYFKSYIGVSPKFYCRIIRLSYVFNLVNQGNFNWLDLVFLGGFYDQSHFIKNFKEFTGEEPSVYGFDEVNMANLFLR